MNYNSDGYIMIDFVKVNFSRTNQTVDGLYDRCRAVIGTNKFVLVINANGKTPLPSTVAITNNKYVIESVLFTFEISSNDNLKITKKTTVDELIDDNHVAQTTTYSSSKIMSVINSAVSDLTFTELTGTLAAGETSIEIEDESITTDSWIVPFTSVYGVNPKTITTIAGKCTLTFDVLADALTVGLRVY